MNAATKLQPAAQPGGYITSKGVLLPEVESEMTETTFFNMWRMQLWPYKELQEGDTLYWYDRRRRAIVWESRIARVDRFEYPKKSAVKERLKRHFDVTTFDGDYFDKAPEYCVAYEVDDVKRVSLPKPSKYNFPQGGWLRCSHKDAVTWFSEQGDQSELLDLEDERQKRTREIVERRGQPEFRAQLIAAYDGRCAVTGCDAREALEAAHIAGYCGPKSNAVANGLLLRADIHTLFDMDLIGIDPNTFKLKLTASLQNTSYGDLHGQPLRLPRARSLQPNMEALTERWKRFSGRSSNNR